MSQSCDAQLKVLVERAIRPIRASSSRKRRMREELLSHVSATFLEESARLGDDQAALDHTAVRFGDPARLSRELQESIPFHDRIRSFVDRAWWPEGKSWLRRATQQAILIDLLLILAPLPSWLLAGAPAIHIPNEFLGVIGFQGMTLLLIGASFSFFSEWMRRVLKISEQFSWRTIGPISTACAVMFVTLALAPDIAIGNGAGVSIADLSVATLFGLIWVPTVVAIFARVAAERIRYEQEWAGVNT